MANVTARTCVDIDNIRMVMRKAEIDDQGYIVNRPTVWHIIRTNSAGGWETVCTLNYFRASDHLVRVAPLCDVEAALVCKVCLRNAVRLVVED